jgi:hypothetical protein
MRISALAQAAVAGALLCAADAAAADDAALHAKVDDIFANYALDAHVPGLVYGIVQDGRLS